MRRPAVLILTITCLLAGASAEDSPPPPAARPRIVSFSPALTEILFDMGLGDHVVAVTRRCSLPAGVRRPRVGDAFTINARTILATDPDVILVQTSPAKFKGITDIDPNVRVEQFRLETLDDIGKAMDRIGVIVHRPGLAKKRKDAFVAAIDSIRGKSASLPRPRVLFVMGTDRPVAAGADTFISDLIEAAGGVNAGADIPGKTRWRSTHIEAIAKAAPDVLICQSLTEARAGADRQYWLQWKDLPAARSGRVYVVSDRQWSIPSARLASLAPEMMEMIHSRADSAGLSPGMSLWRAWVYRLLAAAIVGAALAVGGAALQGLLRNPLAEPYILGISSGAGVGVLLGLALSAWCAVPAWASRPVLAFAGAMITCLVVYSIAQRRGRLDPYSLILAGVIVNSFNAAIMLTIYLYVDPNRIADFAHWAMGRLPDLTDVASLAVCGACVLAGWAILLLNGSAFNVLGLGETVASSSGVAVERLRIVTFLCVGLMTAAAVSLAGPIGFLGLIVPHVCRMIFGPDHRRLILISGVAGAIFLVAAETLCRRAGPWIGVSLIPVGIVTTLAGGPFFIFLLRRRFAETRT